MSKNIDYYKKYYKYKNKYIMLKNNLYDGGARAAAAADADAAAAADAGAAAAADADASGVIYYDASVVIDYIDELSFDTRLLVTTDVFIKIGWAFYDNFKDLVESFGVNIVSVPVNKEWGQDFITKIKLVDRSIQLTIYSEQFKDQYLTEAIPNVKFSRVNVLSNLKTNEYNLGKGGNYISLPTDIRGKKVKKVITLKQTDQINTPYCTYSKLICLKIYLPNFDINGDYGADVFHIDEILTLMPTGTGAEDYNIWFYNPICTENQEYNAQLQAIFMYNYNKLLEFFSEERIKLFNLYFTVDGKIKYPPIFNRILLRKDNKFRIIFPDQKDDNQETAGIKTSVISEMEHVKGIYANIDYHFIDSTKLHENYGNIHCGFKSIPLINFK